MVFRLIVLMMTALLSSPSHAVNDIKLITIESGDEFWSAFGHTALALDDKVYGFGYFSFEDEGLIQSFISNQMQYDLGVSDFDREIELAEWQNRTFIVQSLQLSEAEKNQISQYLNWHSLPENQSYHYDYFLNNCSTKIRDIINNAWGGLLESEFSESSKKTYFTETFPAKNQSLMNIGLALAYGWPAYSARTDWELMAFPVYLYNKIAEMPAFKVSTSEVLYRELPEGRFISLVKTHWILALVFVVVLLLLFFEKTCSTTQKTLWVSQSIIGTILLCIWIFSGHPVLGWNFNLLLFSPFAFLIWRYNQLKWLLMLSYGLWLLLALVLGAWYLVPFWLLHVLSLQSKDAQLIKT